MITIQWLYVLAGLVFGAFAVLSARDPANPKRLRNTGFWGLLSLSFLFGDLLGDFGNGLLVVALVVVGGIGGLGLGRPATTTPEQRREGSSRWGNKLFLCALTIPAVTLFGALVLKEIEFGGVPLLEPKQATLISLGMGVLVALAVTSALTRPPPLAPLQEGRRLIDTVGWAAILPQMLASLGAVFALAGVGEVIGGLAGDYLPLGTRLAAVVAYCLGMAMFTFIMGNAFAAFPVMTAAIGLPILIGRFGGDPAVVCAIGMLAGFCGTLTTPMAANFNVVPANLLELPDRHAPFNGVIRAQVPTAALVLLANMVLMFLLAFR
ncbi:MAG: DUF979 domain-containing protein [Proteobacteria bacterium]|nr:DUF979 domain-containing protein [Pseudomonadota bacterium]